MKIKQQLLTALRPILEKATRPILREAKYGKYYGWQGCLLSQLYAPTENLSYDAGFVESIHQNSTIATYKSPFDFAAKYLGVSATELWKLTQLWDIMTTADQEDSIKDINALVQEFTAPEVNLDEQSLEETTKELIYG